MLILKINPDISLKYFNYTVKTSKKPPIIKKLVRMKVITKVEQTLISYHVIVGTHIQQLGFQLYPDIRSNTEFDIRPDNLYPRRLDPLCLATYYIQLLSILLGHTVQCIFNIRSIPTSGRHEA